MFADSTSIRAALQGTSIVCHSYLDTHPSAVGARLEALQRAGHITLEEIGRSRSNEWPIWGVCMGNKAMPAITLTGNCHAEEPVGTLTILHLLEDIASGGPFAELLERFRIVTIPQMNPDGVINNWPWLSDPTPANFYGQHWRDHRGEDVEHGIAIGNKDFVRPEPRSLVDFYTKNADSTAVYLTLHSSTLEPGAYFLTGNEDEGKMAEAFALIRELAPEIGLPLKGEDTRGYENFRRISHGVYNVPRFDEMFKSLASAGADAVGFRINSLEWMERRGVAISLVSEVPTVIARAMNEEPMEGVDAEMIYHAKLPFLQQFAHDRAAMVEALAAKESVSNPRRLHFEIEYMKAYGMSEPERQARFVACFKGRPALRSHERELVAMPHLNELRLAGIALEIDNGDVLWQSRFHNAAMRLDALLKWEMTPVDAQMRLQLLLILAGAAAAQ